MLEFSRIKAIHSPVIFEAEARDTMTVPTDHLPISLPKGNLRILVADDGKNAADILAMFFEMEGHTVQVVYDGRMAVEVTPSFQPQLIVMDIGMPEMDGLEASRRIREQPDGKEIVIIALSGHDLEQDKRSCAEAGIDHHMAKPVRPDDLRAVIRGYQQGQA
ncbi:response regulator [Luteolibacter flavescens]|uniref:Response regulator n=1 Tax=Luteolibacter flavescens TaxID=1859460 RepID=A0ABT3FQT1_9BACT|nr:response regulator [Luteolibacter flavescens]MCW1885945.1 response regulator [Luteolibacter flavescens]